MIRPAMATIIPPGRDEDVEVQHHTVTREQAERDNLYAALHGDRYGAVSPGRYATLRVGGALMMSDTDMEWDTNREFMRLAHGRVLVGGLGLGFTLIPVLAKPEVESVTVIEKHAAVPRLVLPSLTGTPGFPKLRVIVDDVMTWTPPKGAAWEVIYFDIWPLICGDNVAEMSRLKRRFARRLNRADPRAWMGCWREYDARRRR